MTIKLTDAFVENLPFARTVAAIEQGYGDNDSYTIGDSEIRGLAIKVGLKLKVWQVSVRPLGASPKKEKLGNWQEGFVGNDAKSGEKKTFFWNVANARVNARIRIASIRDGRRPSAEKRADNKQAEIENKQTLRWLINRHKEEWIKKDANGSPKKTSLIGINAACRHLIDWLDMPFRHITNDMVGDRFNKISEEKNKQGKPKLTTANNVFRDLRTVFNNWLSRNPKSDFKNPTTALAKKWHKRPPRKNWLNTMDQGLQFVRWWNAVQAETNQTIRDYLIVTLLQGARESETARLEWEHLDFSAKTISYMETKNGEDYVFPMSPKVYEILLARSTDENRHEVWVFPASKIRRTGDPLNHLSVPPADAVTRVSKRAKVKWAMHDLRRTFSNTLLHLGVEQRDRDYMMKHTIDDVSRHYEILGIVVARNFLKYENHLMSLLNASNKTELENDESTDTREKQDVPS
ncbi:MAG: tyrosine-type recombinase/integrase [Betaproteobacteria bacterium]